MRLAAHHKAAVIHNTPPRSATVPASILNNLTLFQTVSTVPSNGDVNPYGVAFVPSGFPSGGKLNPGDILVANFNNLNNVQGTGTTIVKIASNGTQTLFSTQGASLGLDTGLAVLTSGFVLVANVPNNPLTTVGTPTSPNPQGSILVLDKSGNLLQTIAPKQLNGPWDLTVAVDRGSSATIFVSNVLSGTVWRFNLAIKPSSATPIKVTGAVQVGSGFLHGASQAGFVAGPRAASPTTRLPARCTSPRSSTTRSTPSTTPGIRRATRGEANSSSPTRPTCTPRSA